MMRNGFSEAIGRASDSMASLHVAYIHTSIWLEVMLMAKKVKIGASVLLIVSFFLPWAKDGFFGISTAAPYQLLTGSGIFDARSAGLLYLALPVAGALALRYSGNKAIGLAGGVVSFLLALVFLIRVSSHEWIDSMFGVYIALIASAALAVSSAANTGNTHAAAPAVRAPAAQASAAHCPSCRAAVKPNVKFCGNCGTPVSR
ncbi:MAG: hypothetical protein C6P35_11825 [Cohnella sp.]|jgi:hypothetical protein|nr:MAG: hypothetical protein C6P35_11825 [Cohnella sp.]